MSFESDFWAYLNGQAAVTSVFSSTSPDLIRLYPQVLPQDPTYPAARYQVIGAQRQAMVDGTTNDMVRASVIVDSFGLNPEDAASGAAAFKSALLDYRGQWNGRQISRVLLENEIDLSDVEPGLFRKSQTFVIWHDE